MSVGLDLAHRLMENFAADIREILQIWLIAVSDALPAAIAGACLVAALELGNVRLSRSTRRIGAVFLLAASLVWAWRLRWLCDDAYISFRYADNFAHGRGLVWNLGERVEGYTNFLWTVICAAAIRVGLDPGQFSIVLDLACFAGTLVLTARMARQLTAGTGPVPISALLLGANYTFASFGTSGMETAPAALCVLFSVERATAGAPLIAGLAGVLAILLHPDHLLLVAALGLVLLFDSRRRAGIARFAAPLVLLYGPYFLWRWHYYGDLFPNTYYAKSGGSLYFEQGATYVVASMFNANLIAAIPVALYGCWRLRGTVLGRWAAIGVPVYLLYVAKIGGDYMIGRLVVAILPPIALLTEVGLRALDGRTTRAVATMAAAFCFIPTPLIEPRSSLWYIDDERTLVPLTSFSPITVDSGMFERGQLFERAFRDAAKPPILADTEIGMTGYYSRLPIIDIYGLADSTVARLPLDKRGKPGHEKTASEEYLRSRHVDLSRLPIYESPFEWVSQVILLDRVDSRYHLAHEDERLIAALKGADPKLMHPDFIVFLDNYLSEIMPTRSPAQVRQDFDGFLQPYYFATHVDPERQRRIEAFLAGNAG